MSRLNMSTRRTDSVVVLDLDGRITLGAGSTTLRDSVGALLDAGDRKILLNLARVSYMDSSGVGELVSAFTKVRRQGGELKLINLGANVHGLLEMTKLVTVFETFDSEAEALQSFASASQASPAT